MTNEEKQELVNQKIRNMEYRLYDSELELKIAEAQSANEERIGYIKKDIQDAQVALTTLNTELNSL